MSNNIQVVASAISSKCIWFNCPYCRTKYRRNEDGVLWDNRSKSLEHRHGNDGDMNNRIEFRSGHCFLPTINMLGGETPEFAIVINDTTRRVK